MTTEKHPPLGAPDDLPTPPPVSSGSAPTPSEGLRKPRAPMPSAVLLEQAKAGGPSDSAVRRMNLEERTIVTHERTKTVEVAVGELGEDMREVREQVGGVISRVDTLSAQQGDMIRQLADHAGKIEWMLKRMGAGGGVLGFLWIVFKLAELLSR